MPTSSKKTSSKNQSQPRRTRRRVASAKESPAQGHLTRLGAYGFGKQETVLLAALVTEDPILLIGRSGTGKTYLLNTLSEALGLEHRHYNASLVSFDDLVGFPYPDDEKNGVRFLETPATIWNAESVLVDEISRCKPEHQNRFFSLIHERRVQGIALSKLRYRWAAMNPASVDQGSGGDYLGSEPLDAALADRFAIIVEVGDWSSLSREDQQRVADPSSEGVIADDGGELAGRVAAWRAEFLRELPRCPQGIIEYASAATSAFVDGSVRVSPRRARMLSRTLLAATIVNGAIDEKLFQQVLSVSLPQIAWDGKVPPEKVRAAHQVAWACTYLDERGKWIHLFHLETRLDAKLELLLTNCPDPDTGSLVVEQFLVREPRERAAAFAFAIQPAAVRGAIPIGPEAISDLGRIVDEVIEVSGEIDWYESTSTAKPSSHPEHSRLGRVLGRLSGAREERARQLFYWALLDSVVIPDPEALEKEFNRCVCRARQALKGLPKRKASKRGRAA